MVPFAIVISYLAFIAWWHHSPAADPAGFYIDSNRIVEPLWVERLHTNPESIYDKTYVHDKWGTELISKEPLPIKELEPVQFYDLDEVATIEDQFTVIPVACIEEKNESGGYGGSDGNPLQWNLREWREALPSEEVRLTTSAREGTNGYDSIFGFFPFYWAVLDFEGDEDRFHVSSVSLRGAKTGRNLVKLPRTGGMDTSAPWGLKFYAIPRPVPAIGPLVLCVEVADGVRREIARARPTTSESAPAEWTLGSDLGRANNVFVSIRSQVQDRGNLNNFRDQRANTIVTVMNPPGDLIAVSVILDTEPTELDMDSLLGNGGNINYTFDCRPEEIQEVKLFGPPELHRIAFRLPHYPGHPELEKRPDDLADLEVEHLMLSGADEYSILNMALEVDGFETIHTDDRLDTLEHLIDSKSGTHVRDLLAAYSRLHPDRSIVQRQGIAEEVTIAERMALDHPWMPEFLQLTPIPVVARTVLFGSIAIWLIWTYLNMSRCAAALLLKGYHEISRLTASVLFLEFGRHTVALPPRDEAASLPDVDVTSWRSLRRLLKQRITRE